LDSFQDVERELGGLKKLETVYFEGNPLQTNAPAQYRLKVKLTLPQVKQIDATLARF
jgi:protein phosphatase 1 regulatory subunit 7